MTKAADLYGQSLYMLAAEEKVDDQILSQMETVRDLLHQYPDYVRLLSEPSIARGERLSLLEKAFGGSLHPYLLNFMKLLTERGMMREFAGCTRRYRLLYNRDHGISEAVVTSAVPLSKEQAQRLTGKLEKMSGNRIILVQKVDEKVMGGLKVGLDGTLYEDTVEGRLTELSKKVTGVVL